jgi:hypothetical protein
MRSKIVFRDNKVLVQIFKDHSHIYLNKEEIDELSALIHNKESIELANCEHETGLKILFKNDQYSFINPSKKNETLFTCCNLREAKAFARGYKKGKNEDLSQT